ncbi:SMI1/KNR4 family protein [Sphingomonas sp. OTU376]|uniref:SMI1/KNR4 family protein n=1 Tax=Sphingomonas sp. OTU376 TaxID=3043863 RepID=UPI00313A9825
MAGDFKSAFDAWLVFLNDLGFVAEAQLNPPATRAAIMAVEAEIGFRLPDDLRELYLRADGQKRFHAPIDPTPGTIVTPLFGGYEFASLSRALDDYRTWVDVIDEWGDESDPNEWITLRAGDPPVAREYFRRGWFPFAIDGGGNAYAVDLAPVPGGSHGQIIVIGSDEDERQVLAPGLTAFLVAAAQCEPVWEEGDGPLRFFEIEL